MNAYSSQGPEGFTRRIAQWSSLAAAVLFALAFLNERDRSVFASAELAAYTFFVVAMFAGYALAWRPRTEALGSVLALVALTAAYGVASPVGYSPPSPTFLIVGVPALLHLAAVGWRRSHQPKSTAA